ncbi:MAG: glycosyl transferase family 2 [Acidobacteria bacterium]|nr:glycosyl transferase family 2 [Acidobacteriota bacterium]
MSKTALCLLVWNEKHGCQRDLPRLDFSHFDEVFAIDGGSEDGTVELLKTWKIPVYQQEHRGLNAAYWQAVLTTTCENVVVFFPKGTIPPRVAVELKQALDQGYELAIASRMIAGARNEEDGRLFRPRKWGVKILAMAACAIWRREGGMLWDVLHGVKGFSKQAFLMMNPSRSGVSIDLEMAIRTYRLRIRRCELPVSESARESGATHFKILPTGLMLARCFCRELWRPLR